VTLIVVSGAPGTGKSTIAAALGAALRFPVLSLDRRVNQEGGGHGAAVFPAVAAATTGFTTSGAGLAAGYRHATLAAAVVAAGLAALAARATPSVRPAAGAKVAVH